MDPVANLKRQRELVTKILTVGMTHEEMTDAGYELAELVQALDRWRRKGGFDPYAMEPVDLPASPVEWERIGPRFAELVQYAWATSAENFATDLALRGAKPSALRDMAAHWRDYTFEPPEYAATLEAFADNVEELRAQFNA